MAWCNYLPPYNTEKQYLGLMGVALLSQQIDRAHVTALINSVAARCSTSVTVSPCSAERLHPAAHRRTLWECQRGHSAPQPWRRGGLHGQGTPTT